MPKVGLKDRVKINAKHLDPHIYRMIFVALITAPEFEDDTMIISSANDGNEHKATSKHYTDEAFDIRVRNIKGFDGPHYNNERDKWEWPHSEVVANWAEAIASLLGSDYDVIYELSHIHIEYDPK